MDTASTTAPTGGDTNAPTSVDATTTSATAGTTTTSTFPVVSTEVRGVAVAGTDGGEGVQNTSEASEAVREADGDVRWCFGNPGSTAEGIEDGVPVTFLELDGDAEIGTGSIVGTEWVDEDPGFSQWSCLFHFEGAVEGNPDAFRIKVGDLEPWVVMADTTNPGEWITSVTSDIDPQRVDECATPPEFPQDEPWSAAGQYWDKGFRNMCKNRMIIARIEHTCSPPLLGSDRIIAVASAADPDVVYDDLSGSEPFDTSTLPPDTEVLVWIANGQPCG